MPKATQPCTTSCIPSGSCCATGPNPNAKNLDGDCPLDLAPDAEHSRTHSAIRSRGGHTGRTLGGQLRKLLDQ